MSGLFLLFLLLLHFLGLLLLLLFACEESRRLGIHGDNGDLSDSGSQG